MRSENEMLEQIMNYAGHDEKVRAVYMNGSRANPNVEKDKFRDFDIVFVVTEMGSFLEKKDWIKVFGDVAIVQEPDSSELGWGTDCDSSKGYTWLILFKDWNRLDLHLEIIDEALKNYGSDTLTVPLLDKDGFLPSLPPPSEKGYYIQKPSKERYRGCCNEFWWCLNNVAKGIKREQLPYAMWMLNTPVRYMLGDMLDWYIGTHYDFAVTTGMMGKYYKKYLPEHLCSLLKRTYCDGNYESLWRSVFVMTELFGIIAPEVGKFLGFEYNESEEENVLEYLRFMKNQ